MTTEPATRLLDCAEAAFVRDGYGAANLGEIARAAGISKKTIYRHVASKEALFGAVVERAIKQTGSLDRLDDDGEAADPVAGLRDFMIAHARLALSERGVRIHGLVIAEARRFPELARTYDQIVGSTVVSSLSAWLAKRVQAGCLETRSPERVATMLMNMVVSDPLYRATMAPEDLLGEDAIEERVDIAVTLLLFGLVPRRVESDPAISAV